ncbi:hypothetical protein BaRGS_00033293 [Batillaria attramentaria]|uniref:Nudix hydrolase domain-containing protein n=1 Tax=Batillaria attramentaria TaxID=370345 RepID=A0ABD0JKE7_9CAEN
MADCFKAGTDRYNGVILDADDQNFKSDAEFIEKLKAAIPEWRKIDKRGLWVKVDHKHAGLVPLLSQMGLEFHHAQPGYVMMTMWMSEDLPNYLPEYANQYIGVAGFVVNEKNQLLVIQEQYHTHKRSHWKLPGGHADKGEDLAETAEREVREETGVESEFVSLIAFRHQHNYRFGCSDLYFICLMRPLTQEIKTCPHEIAACKWIDLDDYIADPGVSDANRHFAQCYKDGLKHNGLAIIPSKVLSHDKRVLHNIYSIQAKTRRKSDQALPLPNLASSTEL